MGRIDVYGHMNNARYFELIDTVVNNQLVVGVGTDIRELPAIGVVAEVSCRYFEEIGYPDPVDLGVAVEKVGRSSVVYLVGLFQGGRRCSRRAGTGPRAASSTCYVDNTVDALGPLPSSPMPDEVRRAVESPPPALMGLRGGVEPRHGAVRAGADLVCATPTRLAPMGEDRFLFENLRSGSSCSWSS